MSMSQAVVGLRVGTPPKLAFMVRVATDTGPLLVKDPGTFCLWEGAQGRP